MSDLARHVDLLLYGRVLLLGVLVERRVGEHLLCVYSSQSCARQSTLTHTAHILYSSSSSSRRRRRRGSSSSRGLLLLLLLLLIN